MRILVSIAIAGLLASPFGCKSKDEGEAGQAPVTGEKPAEAEDTASDSPAATTGAGAETETETAVETETEAAAAEAELPTPEDFEEEVKKDVTKENLEKELKEIEDELGE